MKTCFRLFFLLAFVPIAVPAQTTFTTFDDFLKQHSTSIFSAERDSLFTRFWGQARRQGIPWIDSNRTDVVFLYRGPADTVKVHGNFTSWTFALRMKRLPETDLFYIKLSMERDARIDYMFLVDGKEIRDPLNALTAPGMSGDRSELAMPEFHRSPEWAETGKGPKGTLTTLTIPSKTLAYDHKVLVYLPPGYDTSKANYPVVYFQDGQDYINLAKTPTIFDNMIAAQAIPAVIGVFVVPPSEGSRNRTTEYAMNDLYVKFFTKELLPSIDKKYRTNTAARSVIGSALGGLASLYIAFTSPELVGSVASQSGYVSYNNDTLQTLFQKSRTRPIRVYLDVGTFEKNVGAAPDRPAEGNFVKANRSMKRILDQKEYVNEYREFHDGHGWGRWKNELPSILRWLVLQSKPE